jgi:hypothetical protein
VTRKATRHIFRARATARRNASTLAWSDRLILLSHTFTDVGSWPRLQKYSKARTFLTTCLRPFLRTFDWTTLVLLSFDLAAEEIDQNVYSLAIALGPLRIPFIARDRLYLRKPVTIEVRPQHGINTDSKHNPFNFRNPNSITSGPLAVQLGPST